MVTYKLTHTQFYQGLKEGKLLGLKCNDCGVYTCPPKINCSECASMNLEVVELKGRAGIKTFTVVRVAPEGFEEEVPYIVALAQLEEGPNVIGNIIGIDPDQVTDDIIGKEVTIGYKIPPAAVNFTGGEAVALTFSLV